jgi:hypothetical protein
MSSFGSEKKTEKGDGMVTTILGKAKIKRSNLIQGTNKSMMKSKGKKAILMPMIAVLGENPVWLQLGVHLTHLGEELLQIFRVFPGSQNLRHDILKLLKVHGPWDPLFNLVRPTRAHGDTDILWVVFLKLILQLLKVLELDLFFQSNGRVVLLVETAQT